MDIVLRLLHFKLVIRQACVVRPVVRCNIAWVIEYTVPQTQAILRNEPGGDCLLISRGHPWIDPFYHNVEHLCTFSLIGTCSNLTNTSEQISFIHVRWRNSPVVKASPGTTTKLPTFIKLRTWIISNWATSSNLLKDSKGTLCVRGTIHLFCFGCSKERAGKQQHFHIKRVWKVISSLRGN